MKHQRLDPPPGYDGADAANPSNAASAAADFDPVPLRHRHYGWTPHRQARFIRAHPLH